MRVNRSLSDIVGYSERSSSFQIFKPSHIATNLGSDLAEVYRLLAGETLTCQLEKRYIHKLGHEVWTACSASLVRDAKARPLHFIFQIRTSRNGNALSHNSYTLFGDELMDFPTVVAFSLFLSSISIRYNAATRRALSWFTLTSTA